MGTHLRELEQEFSAEYQHDRAEMVKYKNLCNLVLWIKVVSALERLTHLFNSASSGSMMLLTTTLEFTNILRTFTRFLINISP